MRWQTLASHRQPLHLAPRKTPRSSDIIDIQTTNPPVEAAPCTARSGVSRFRNVGLGLPCGFHSTSYHRYEAVPPTRQAGSAVVPPWLLLARYEGYDGMFGLRMPLDPSLSRASSSRDGDGHQVSPLCLGDGQLGVHNTTRARCKHD